MFSLQDFMDDEDRALSDLVEPIASAAQGRRRGLGRGERPRGAKAGEPASRRQPPDGGSSAAPAPLPASGCSRP